MISYIKGALGAVEDDVIVVETGGIGLAVHVPLSLLEELPPLGEEVTVYTYFQVREDAMTLYGFLHRQDREMFKQLLGVNGIGPKAAMGVLAAITADELRFAVLSDDVKTISRAPGIGKKTAQKLILELKDKLKLEDAFEKKLDHQEENLSLTDTSLRDSRQEAVEALTALGYSSTNALRAVRQVSEETGEDVEAILKAALKQL